jgi:hypothetical protein
VLADGLGAEAGGGGTNDGVKSNAECWEQGQAYIRKIFQGRSHLFDAGDVPEYP